MAILGNGGSVDASFTITQSNSGSEDGSNKSNSGRNDPLGTGGGGEKSLGHNPADRNPPQNTGEGDRLEQHSDGGNLPPKRHHRSGGFLLRLAENLQSLIRDLASPQLEKAPEPTQLSPEDYNRFADLAAGCGSGVYGKFVNTKGLAGGAAIAHLIRRHKYKEAVQEAILSWIPYKFIVDCYTLADDIELFRNWPTPYSRSPVGSPAPRPPPPKNTSPPSSPGPDAPSNVHIESYNGQLQWTDDSNNEDGFRIYQNGSPTGTAPANAAVYQGTLVLNCDDVLSVSAYNVAGESTRVASSNMPSHLLPSCR